MVSLYPRVVNGEVDLDRYFGPLLNTDKLVGQGGVHEDGSAGAGNSAG